jgi:hypothetical protein
MSTTHVGRWIKTLADVGLKPEMFEIESVLEWQEAEAFWIKYFRSIGAQLCNTAPGGGWYPGCQHAVETLKKREATAKSRGLSSTRIGEPTNKPPSRARNIGTGCQRRLEAEKCLEMP